MAETFEQTRAAFEAAWRVFLARRSEADFDAYRRDRAFQVWKQTMWAKGLQLPTQVADGRSACFCGRTIGIADVESHVLAAHMQQVSC